MIPGVAQMQAQPAEADSRKRARQPSWPGDVVEPAV
jgi:hypothetical protein